MRQISPSKLFAPAFKQVYQAIFYSDITHFFLKGGRGSTKSTFVAMCILLGIMRDAAEGETVHAVVLRRVDNTLRESVHSQMLKAASLLGMDYEWKAGFSPLLITYKRKNLVIQFHGVDDPIKLKSITPKNGYFKYIWIEEAAEFDNMEHIRSVLQSVMRGGEVFKVFYTFNPPRDVTHWLNVECEVSSANRLVHHSTYLDVPKEWLGPAFIAEAEDLQLRNPSAYEHEYLGIATGVEGQIFQNVKIEVITAKQILGFEKTSCGLDWGYSIDPLGIIWDAWDAKRRLLYLWDEAYKMGMSNSQAAEEVKKRKWRTRVICDNAEPKSIADISGMGIKAIPCRKGKGSIARGIKWLAKEVDGIVIDSDRCPNAYKEFRGYAYEKDASGAYKREYPDKNNHLIDATRYSSQDWMANSHIR